MTRNAAQNHQSRCKFGGGIQQITNVLVLRDLCCGVRTNPREPRGSSCICPFKPPRSSEIAVPDLLHSLAIISNWCDRRDRDTTDTSGRLMAAATQVLQQGVGVIRARLATIVILVTPAARRAFAAGRTVLSAVLGTPRLPNATIFKRVRRQVAFDYARTPTRGASQNQTAENLSPRPPVHSPIAKPP
jgi:hypothetical protein